MRKPRRFRKGSNSQHSRQQNAADQEIKQIGEAFLNFNNLMKERFEREREEHRQKYEELETVLDDLRGKIDPGYKKRAAEAREWIASERKNKSPEEFTKAIKQRLSEYEKKKPDS
ncbi:hypothetical protein SFC65_19030 [Priestia filamentosa]|uniref:hypothetical protein n=1 Tax=Priestia filamentosa TaxID=1402861 RepID=UPI003981DF8B